MTEKMRELIEKLEKEHSLSLEEYEYLIDNRDEESRSLLSKTNRICPHRKGVLAWRSEEGPQASPRGSV